MSLAFPLNPTQGQEYSQDGVTWVWNGSSWDIVPDTSPVFETITANSFIGNGSLLTNINYDNLTNKPNIPATTGNTSELPQQTTSSLFRSPLGTEALREAAISYWTSTQRNSPFNSQNYSGIFANNGGYGTFGSSFKNDNIPSLRAIRRVRIR